MEASTVSIDQVRSLVSERQRYDDWLGALEAKRSETPVRVYERVQADYRSRRNDVTSRLREHVEMLSTLQVELESRLGVVDAELTELGDARAEAMLRTSVGEFDSERWEQVRRDVEAGIEEQTSARTSLVAELEEVRALLSSARSEPAQAATVASETSHTAPADDVQELLDVDDVESAATVAVGADAGSAGDANAAADAVSVESIAEWESVLVNSATADISDDVLPIDRRDPASESQPPVSEFHEDFVTPTTGRRDGDEKIADDSFDDLAFLRSVVDADPSSSARENGSANNAGRAGSSVADQQKTLRCTD